jgi:asparagine synthase (glutamine-hydrolysing)
MCGISGIFNFSKKKIDNKEIIKKILNIQDQRGPDNKELWESECKKITFGHNRLSIIDLSKNSNQPFISEDENYIITFNGEIYNFKELKKELIKKNFFFKTNSDTEVILQSYRCWGLNFVKYLRGMFAFAIYDKTKKNIILARDPFGIKPLYYVNKNGVLYFASLIRSLLSIKDISFTTSKAGICSYYMWGHIQEPFTLYNEIKSLEKGTIKIINTEGIESNLTYASIKETMLNSIHEKFDNEQDGINFLKDELDQSLNYHQISDVPITLLLSSGIDSNILLASISKDNKKNLDALTLDFDFKGNKNESKIAAKSASNNNINHKIKRYKDTEIKNLLEKFFIQMDSPTSDGFNNFLISNEVNKNDKKIMISGVGADELFLGYPSFKRIPIIYNLFKFLPSINLNQGNIVFKMFNRLNINSKYLGLLKYHNSYEKIFFLQRCSFLPEELKFLVDEHTLNQGLEELNIFDDLKQDVKDFDNNNLLTMFLEIKYYLCSRLLRDGDWSSMSNSVEMRTPYVDWFFFKNILKVIKSDIKINKKTLLNIYNKNIPVELYKRKKTGFEIPHSKYYNLASNKKGHFSKSIKNWTKLSMDNYMKNN